MTSYVLAFNGERLDPVGETYHLGNGYRAYNPVLMRFTSPDSWSPFGAGGINPYAYCAGDPINRSDPTGHMSWQAGLGIGLGILGILGAVFTGGASIAAAGSISAALAGASTVSLVVGTAALVADVTGVASAATEESNPKASAALGWTSLAFGILSLGAGLAGRVLKNGKNIAGQVAQATDLRPKMMSNIRKRLGSTFGRTEAEAEDFKIFSGKRKPGEVSRAIVDAHGRQLPDDMGLYPNVPRRVPVPTETVQNYYCMDGQKLNVKEYTGGIVELASGLANPVQSFSDGEMTTNYILTLFEHDKTLVDLQHFSEHFNVDIIVPNNPSTLGRLYIQLQRTGISYKTIEAGFCRSSWEGARRGMSLNILPNY
jgi:RHS repeat-associated protein